MWRSQGFIFMLRAPSAAPYPRSVRSMKSSGRKPTGSPSVWRCPISMRGRICSKSRSDTRTERTCGVGNPTYAPLPDMLQPIRVAVSDFMRQPFTENQVEPYIRSFERG
jgi:hypothetical protein